MSRIRLRLIDEGEGDDPLLSMVNLIDVFLVLVAALLLALARNPQLSAATAQALPEGRKVERFQGEGASTTAEGGVRAGTAYRLPDGSMVVVPE